MLDVTEFDTNGLFKYRNGRVVTTRNEPSSENCIRIDLEEIIEYASTLKTTLRGNTLIRWTQAKSMSFDVNWTSYIQRAEFDHPQAHTEQVACSCEKQMVSGVCVSTTEL